MGYHFKTAVTEIRVIALAKIQALLLFGLAIYETQNFRISLNAFLLHPLLKPKFHYFRSILLSITLLRVATLILLSRPLSEFY